MAPMLLSASVTPLRDGGARVDEDAIEPLARFLLEGGVDGIFALGTTGEGVLLGMEERKTVAQRFREARAGKLIVHCGAQSTAETAALAAHAAGIGADGVAVIPPPYYPLGDDALVEHFVAAASACAPTPFYLYAFAARSGYPLPIAVVERVRERTENVAGLKVSEAPFDRVEPYLGLGLPVYVGAEKLILTALAAGAAGAVSGLASAFPETVAEVVANPDAAGSDRLEALRGAVERFPFQSALKAALRARGVPIEIDVRAPLPALRPDQVAEVGALATTPRAAAPARELRGRRARGRIATAPTPASAWPSIWARTRAVPPSWCWPAPRRHAVAAEVARALRAPLDVFCVRKLGVPGDEELAMGAIADGGVVVVNDRSSRSWACPNGRWRRSPRRSGRSSTARKGVPRRSCGHAARRPHGGPGRRWPGHGASMRAAVRAVRAAGPGRVVVAVPVAAAETCRALETDADEVVCALVPEGFRSVGGWYEDFSATSDDEVRRCCNIIM